MRVKFPLGSGQALSLLALILFFSFFSSCRRQSGELPVTPPLTHPLSRAFIGYGVVNVSFTHLLSEPGLGGTSQDYIRRGTVVRVVERRVAHNGGVSESWVLVEGNNGESGGVSPGWLEEATVDIYDNESRAQTASKAMNR